MTPKPLPLCQDRVIGDGVIAALPEIIARHKLGKRIMIVCDDTTYVAAGQQIFVNLLPTLEVKAHSLGRQAIARLLVADELTDKARGFTGMLAVGAGTVNDVTKYAAHTLGIPYICVPTAASMNGFTSATASLLADGIKLSLPASPPKAVVADMNILAAAPKKLARAGVGDTLCRTTVEADCLLSHHLIGTPYPRDEFIRMRRHEAALIADIPKLKDASHEYLGLLMEALLDAGDAMATAGSSVTASQGEHMIAHTLEMIYSNELRTLHGEMIGVTSRTMSDLQNKMLFAMPVVKHMPREESYFSRVFGKRMGPLIAVKYMPKVLSHERVSEINARLPRQWPTIKQQLSEVIVQTSSIDRAFIHANIPHFPKDIGLNDDRYNAAVTYAYLTRNRFTFLDLAQMMGKRV